MKNLNLICFLLVFGFTTVFTACGGNSAESQSEEETEITEESMEDIEDMEDMEDMEMDSLEMASDSLYQEEEMEGEEDGE